jgi:hypothetical protein
MKRIFVFLSLVILVQAACALSPTPNATQAALVNTVAVSASTPTLDFTGKLFPGGTALYAGPGEDFPSIGVVTDSVKIIGQGYGCTWFLVESSRDNKSGWLKADQLTYTVRCADVPGAQIPPTIQPTNTLPLLPSETFTLIPTETFTQVPTRKASGPLPASNSCSPQSSMVIGNRTGSYAEFRLVGPGTFYVSLPPDENTTVAVCEGCYDVYILNGACGDSSGSMVFRLCDSFNGWIYCNK